ncbi:MAG: InlB B-repeat-containing protein [Oscillospiraceae bacterium]|nr:InlB B-repeat-containing protein [Oscillospiraceae bacterium]
MSKFKRFLSSFLALAMVLGMFSMLGGVFAVDASAAATPYTTHIKTYAELEGEHPNGFYYFGVEFIEADGQPTDHIVSPGDTLTVRFYIKSSFYLTAQVMQFNLDRNFFDITNGQANGWIANRGPDLVEGKCYPTNNYPTPIPKALLSDVNPNYNEETGNGPYVSLVAQFATVGSKYLVYNARTGYTSKIFETAEEIEAAKGLDYYKLSGFYGDSKLGYKMTDDMYICETTLTVRDNLTPGTSGKIFQHDRDVKLNNSAANGYVCVCDTDSGKTADSKSFEKSPLFTADMFDNEGLDQIFYIDDGGSTPVQEHTATFMANGAVYSSATYAEGAEIAAPATPPTKDGYTFAGWSLDGTNVVTFPQTMGTADVTYTAIFVENAKYKATFLVDGAAYGDVNSYAEGEQIVAPADPSKTGYTFTGWDPAVGTMGNADMTFNAKFEAKTYNVKFMNGDAQHDANTVKYDGAYTLPAAPTKDGYTFAGWVDAEGNAMPATHTTDGDVTFYAKWVTSAFDAKFYLDAAKTDLYDTKSVEFGAAITAPAAPSKTGYTFKGWSLDGSTVLADLGTMDTEGKDFIAVFEALSSGVTFYDGDTVLETKTGNFGDKINAIDNPTKAGYTFAGWVDASGDAVTFPVTLGLDPISVYAKWTANPIFIEFYDGANFISGGEQNCGEAIVAPEAPVKAGYNFVGWVDANGDAMPATVPTADAKYYTKYEAATYNVTFKADGETVRSEEALFGSTIVPPDAPSKVGNTFKGWAVEGTTDIVTFDDNTTVPVGGVTYVAIFEANTYKVTYYVDNVIVHTVDVKYGDPIPEYTYTPEAGESFGGWTTTIPETMPANDVNIYGTTSTNNYTVTFNVNGKEYTKLSFAYGATVTAPAYTVPEGYSFSGWNLPETMPAENITLDATLTKNSYFVKYYLFEGDTKPYAEFTVSYGDVIPTPDVPEKPGYQFQGWDYENLGTATMPAQALNIYANMAKEEYAIEFEGADGNIVSDWIGYYGDTITADQTPEVTKEGSRFVGWTVNGVDVTFPYTVNGDTTFVPKFTTNGYILTYIVDGEVYSRNTYDFGAALPAADTPTKEGHTFSGWDRETPATMPAEDITISGSFTPNKYDATFYKDGVLFATVPTDFGQVPVAPTEGLEKVGYTFTGWNPALTAIGVDGARYDAMYVAQNVDYKVNVYTMGLDGNYGEPEVLSYTATADSSVTYPAAEKTGFTIADNSVLSGTVAPDGSLVLSVYYSRNQYTFKTVVDGVEAPVTYYYGADIEAPAAPVKEGYTFVKWDATIPATMPARDVTVTAVFKINQYTITFVTDGGTAVAPITQDYGTAVTAPAAPTKVGYTFAGWDKAIPETIPAEDMTITAKWTVNQYTITFNTDGGSDVAPITQDYGTAVAAPAAPTKAGYTFAGWYKDGVAYTFTTMPAEDITLTAKWSTDSHNAIFVIDGVETIVPTEFGQIPVAPPVSKIGYTFTGWDKELVAMGTEDVTYTAQFKANTYDAIFDANGGAFADGKTSVTVPTVFDTAIVAPTEEPTRYGYTFNGWSPAVGNMTSEGITFTAQWKQDLSICRIQNVTRVTPNVYGRQVADYEVTVKGSPIKIEFAYTGGSEVYWQYDRHDPIIDLNDVEATGLFLIKAYNAAGEEVALGSADTDYEVWSIRAIYTEGTYKVRAKVAHSDDSWEPKDIAYDFVNTYDVEPIDPNDLTSATISKTTVKRGDYVYLTVVTSTNVNRVRIAKTEADGTLATVAFSTTAKNPDNLTITDADGVRTWNIRIRFSYVGNDDYQIQNWKLQYRKVNGDKWLDSEYNYDIKITKYAETVSPVEGKDPFSVISVATPVDSIAKGSFAEVTVVTTSDASRIRLTVAGKSSTYLKTSQNTISVTDNGDGTTTWVVKYRFATAGTATVTAQARGNAWSSAVAGADVTVA